VGVLTRDIDPATLAALAEPIIYPIVMVYLDWPGGAIRVHSGVGTIQWDGEDWLGVGPFGAVQMPGEESGLISQPAQLRLIGVPDELDAYLDDPIRDEEGEILFALTTERTGNVLIGEPFSIFIGYMDAMRDVVEADDGVLRRDLIISLAGGPSQRAFTDLFHTDEDQKTRFPSDTAGRLVQNAEAEGKKLTWPE
jgi:hypothetical protein